MATLQKINHQLAKEVPLLDKLSLYYTELKAQSRKIGLACWFISYLQQLAIIMKTAYYDLGSQETGISIIFHTFFKIFTISDLLDYESSDIFSVCIFIAVFIYVLLLIVQTFIIFTCIKRAIEVPNIVTQFWKGISHIHPYIVFFPIHNISLQIISNYAENNLLSDSPTATRTALLIFAIIVLVCNFVITWLPVVLLETVIGSKDILSSKTRWTNLYTVSHKTLIPVLLSLSQSDKNHSSIFLYPIIFSLCLLLLAEGSFYYFLPYYKIKILKLTGMTNITLIVYAVLTFFSHFVFNDYKGKGFLFVNGCWLVLSPFLAKISKDQIESILNSILSRPDKLRNPYYLIHYWYIYKHFASLPKQPFKRSFNEAYLRSEGSALQIKANSTMKANIQESEETTNLKENKLVLDFIKGTLEEKCRVHKHSFLLRLSLILHMIRFGNSYVHPYHMLEELIHNRPPFAIRTSLQRLKLELQNKIQTKYDSMAHQSLDIQKYIVMNAAYQQLRDQIEKQLTYQTKFWEHFTSLEPDLYQLIKYSKKAYKMKNEVERDWQHFEKQRENEFISPLLLYAIYSSIANNDIRKEDQYLEKYYKTAEKIRVQLQADEFTNKTLFSEENFVVTITSSLKAIGRIVDVSSNFQDYIGLKKEYVIGRSVGIIQSPFFRDRHDDILRRHFESGTARVLGKPLTLPVLNAEGYVMPCCAEFQINPQVHHDISYIALFRKMKNHKRLVLVRENGEIDAYSKDFARDMGITQPISDENKLNIFSFSKEFENINSVFNEIAKRKIRQEEDLPLPLASQEVYEKYNQGSDITLESKNQKLVDYYLKIDLVIIQNDFLKIFYLTNKHHIEDLEEEHEHIVEVSYAIEKSKTPSSGPEDLSIDNPIVTHKKSESFRQPVGDDNQSNIATEDHDLPLMEDNENESPQLKKNMKFQLIKLKGIKGSEFGDYENQNMVKVIDLKKRLKKKLLGATGNDASSVTSSVQLGAISLQKVVKDSLESNKQSGTALFLKYAFFLCLILTLGFLLFQTMFVNIIADEVKEQNTVIRLSFQRRNWVQSFHLWSTILYSFDLGFFSLTGNFAYDHVFLRLRLNDSWKGLYTVQNTLLMELAKSRYDHIKDLYFMKNTTLYDRDLTTNILTPIGQYNAFGAGIVIAEAGKAYAQSTFIPPSVPYHDPTLIFISDNSINDLMVSATQTIEISKWSLSLLLDDALKLMVLILVLSFIMVGAIFLLLLWFNVNLIKQSHQFSNILFTIQLDEAEQTRDMVNNLLQIIKKNMSDSQIIHEIEQQRIIQRKQKLPQAKANMMVRKASTGRYKRNLILLFLGTIPMLILIICFILVFYYRAQFRLDQIRKEQEQMEYGFEMMFLQNCLMNQVISFTVRYGISTYRNNDPFEEFKKDLERYSADKYLETLKDKNGELTEDESNLLFNFPCERLTPAINGTGAREIVSMCQQYSNNKTIGLLDLVSSNSLLFLSIRDDFEKLPKIKAYLQALIGRLMLINSRLELTSAMMYMSWNFSLKQLLEQIDLVKKEGIVLTGVSIGICLVIGIFAWGWVLLTMLRKPKESDQVLLLIPTKVLLGNRHIRKYVLDKSKGKLNNYRLFL